MKPGWWFLVGVLAGVLFVVGLTSITDQTPGSYQIAAAPAIKAAQMDDGHLTASDLKRALNPCITSGQLPAGCEKYVKDGVVTQPPIKIILDTTQ